jgi:hypothetical protein
MVLNVEEEKGSKFLHEVHSTCPLPGDLQTECCGPLPIFFWTCSASQELCINKLIARWHMSDCNPTKIPCSGKLDEILKPLQLMPTTPDPAPLRDYKELISSLLFFQSVMKPNESKSAQDTLCR